MKSIELYLGHTNYVAVEETTYFLRNLMDSTQLLPTRCPHRGGPLHLGEMTDDNQSVICPWHTTAYKVCNLEKKSLPVVRVRDQISAVIGDAERYMPLLRLSHYDTWHS